MSQVTARVPDELVDALVRPLTSRAESGSDLAST